MSTEQTFTLNLTLDQLNTVLGGLAELPARVSMNLIQNIQKQAQQQAQAQSQPEVVEAEPVEES